MYLVQSSFSIRFLQSSSLTPQKLQAGPVSFISPYLFGMQVLSMQQYGPLVLHNGTSSTLAWNPPSTARSPMQMFASVLKENYHKKDAEDGRTTFHIAIMPCTAKKMEARREEFRDAYGVPYVDLVLTTQEVVQMMKESGIRFQMLEKESPDLPYGMGSGAAEIFGTSGGVAEAVIRCCTPDKSKNALRTIEHSGIRGTDAVRFAEVAINGRKVRAAIVHGLGSAAKLLDQIQSGEVQADLVEVMSCRTGCVGGAGQPYALMAKKLQRAQGLYEIDRSAMFKRSERNPVIDAMYANGLADRAHELLHIEYKD